MRKLLTILVTVAAFSLAAFLPLNIANAHEGHAHDEVSVTVFVREGCIHCQAQERFLDELDRQREGITITYYRLENEKDRAVWEAFTTRVGTGKVTPITVVGDRYIVGFDDAQTSGEEILALIESAKKRGIATDIDSSMIAEAGSASTCDEEGIVPCAAEPSRVVSLPIVGRIDAQKYPLLILSAMLGFFDGFNPCAMWVLITFLIILLQVGNRRKMLLFAGTFIIAEAVMYTLILTVWYKTWDFVRLDSIVTPIVGAVSITGGLFFLKEYRKKELECKVTNLEKRAKTRQRILELATNRFTILTFLGILGIAFSVNIIEFACSIGIPQAFTKILELNNVSLLPTVFAIGTYVLFYMIDDFIVFGVALWGIDKLHLATRYSKLSNLLGGIVMVVLGLLLLLRPQLLMF